MSHTTRSGATYAQFADPILYPTTLPLDHYIQNTVRLNDVIQHHAEAQGDAWLLAIPLASLPSDSATPPLVDPDTHMLTIPQDILDSLAYRFATRSRRHHCHVSQPRLCRSEIYA